VRSFRLVSDVFVEDPQLIRRVEAERYVKDVQSSIYWSHVGTALANTNFLWSVLVRGKHVLRVCVDRARQLGREE